MTNIEKIIAELKRYENQDKQKILSIRIQERLDKALQEYYNSVSKAFDKLEIYNNEYEIKLIKKLNKE